MSLLCVQAFIRNNIETVTRDWGFTYLKLDFLYSAALKAEAPAPEPGAAWRGNGRSCTRAQALRQGMQLIRDAAGPRVFILGCGAPLGSVIGLVQGNRVSAGSASYMYIHHIPKTVIPVSIHLLRRIYSYS